MTTRLPSWLVLSALVLASPAWSLPGQTDRQAAERTINEAAELEEAEDGVLFEEDPEAAEAVSEEENWSQNERDKIAVDEAVLNKPWNAVPFRTDVFNYTDAQMKQRWPHLMRALLIPFPSAEYLEKRIEYFPELKEELGPDFDGDYEALSRQILQAWRYFFRGEFRKARDHGRQFGAFGKVPAYFSQIIYAVYLSDTQTEKHQLLQDTANQVADYVRVLKEMKDHPEFQEDYIMLRLGYAYALARIAEEVSPAVAVMRNYLFRISGACNDVLDINPEHPVALAFRAGIDANLIRTMGKAAGRLTFGARESRAEQYFGDSFSKVSDLAIIHYEFANALLYMNKKRELQEALLHLQTAMYIHPGFAMEALDSMYAAKRMRELQDFVSYRRSFRSYDRKRRKYIKETDENLHNITKPPFLITEYVARN